jgi:hypothetical protein
MPYRWFRVGVGTGPDRATLVAPSSADRAPPHPPCGHPLPGLKDGTYRRFLIIVRRPGTEILALYVPCTFEGCNPHRRLHARQACNLRRALQSSNAATIDPDHWARPYQPPAQDQSIPPAGVSRLMTTVSPPVIRQRMALWPPPGNSAKQCQIVPLFSSGRSIHNYKKGNHLRATNPRWGTSAHLERIWHHETLAVIPSSRCRNEPHWLPPFTP